jgi:hypothetical protein
VVAYPFGSLEQHGQAREVLALSFPRLIEQLRQVIQDFPDKRTGQNSHYRVEEAALGAFSVFFTQSPSFLAHQKSMAVTKGQNNARSLFGIQRIPCDIQIRKLLDEVAPSQVLPVFTYIFDALKAAGALSSFLSSFGGLLIALDGTEYFSSKKLHCPNCSSRQHQNGSTTYFHSVVTPVVVAPGQDKVIALEPEFILPQDGHAKQDCETAAGKRWLDQYGARYGSLDATILGDDLYCHQPMCERVLAAGCHFLLTCKPDSHPTLYEWLEGLAGCGGIGALTVQRWTGKERQLDTYRYAQQVPLRDGADGLLVNWCELTTTREDGTVLYRNAFATDHPITEANVAACVAAGRARWKVENENNNTLKTKGYHLEHNYGHGQKHLAALLATFNILAFLIHTVLELVDEQYRLIRSKLPTRQTFFDDVRALTRYLYFASWEGLLDFMMRGLELEVADGPRGGQ